MQSAPHASATGFGSSGSQSLQHARYSADLLLYTVMMYVQAVSGAAYCMQDTAIPTPHTIYLSNTWSSRGVLSAQSQHTWLACSRSILPTAAAVVSLQSYIMHHSFQLWPCADRHTQLHLEGCTGWETYICQKDQMILQNADKHLPTVQAQC